MADDDDFFGVGAFGCLDQMLREAVDALVPFGRSRRENSQVQIVSHSR